MIDPKNIKISDFDYQLPDDKIAKFPLKERDKCKLLIYNGNNIIQDTFENIGNYLNKVGLLVVNNTKVIPARLEFFTPNGAKIEIFCLEPQLPADYDSNFAAKKTCNWHCLAGNLKRWKNFNLTRQIPIKNTIVTLQAEKLETNGGEIITKFSWDGEFSFSEIIDAFGAIPIPPYLNRKAEESDNTDYQTVYSKYKGSVAAPTAGLHFTSELLNKLAMQKANITLHVGAGTFKPVKTETIGEHAMHKEFFSVSLNLLKQLINHQGKITAVGTTSVRTLESLHWLGVKLINGQTTNFLNQWECYELDSQITPSQSISAIIKHLEDTKQENLKASTGIMICPGYKYKIVSDIITNFHQPQSTLLLLVSAAIGNKWKEIYNYALDNDFRFLSYGDGSLLKVINN